MQSNARALRVGIIGTGWVAGDRHVPVYRADARATVVAVCDRDLAKAQAFAAQRSIPYATDSLPDLLDQQLDLVSICTPPFAHHAAAIAALAAGCHVFMEKPMAMDAAAAAQIAVAAREASRLLCVSHNLLFSRAMRRIRGTLASGAAGRIQFVIGMQASSPLRRLPTWYGALPAGLFFDESPHLLYLMTSLLGPLTVVHASATPNTPGAVQPVRSVHAVFSTATAPATLTMTFEAPLSEWYLLIVCERRVLVADLFRDVSMVLGPDGHHTALDILKTSAAAGIQHAAGVVESGVRVVAGSQHWGHERLINAMIGAVISGGRSPVPVSQSLAVMRVMDAILSAIR